MSAQQLNNIDPKAFKKLVDDVEKIKNGLLGDPDKPDKKGVFAQLITINEDLYSNGTGLKRRVQWLEEYKIKLVAYCGALSLALSLGAWIVDRFVLKK